MSATTTSAPAAASVSASARPRPREPPVTSATRPERSISSATLVASHSRVARAHRGAAKRRVAASSVASVAYGYERSLRPCDARFSRPAGHDLLARGTRQKDVAGDHEPLDLRGALVDLVQLRV